MLCMLWLHVPEDTPHLFLYYFVLYVHHYNDGFLSLEAINEASSRGSHSNAAY